MRWVVMDIVVLSKDRVVDVTREPNGMTRPLDMPPYTYETQAEAEEVAQRFDSCAVPLGVLYPNHEMRAIDLMAAEVFLRMENGDDFDDAAGKAMGGGQCE